MMSFRRLSLLAGVLPETESGGGQLVTLAARHLGSATALLRYGLLAGVLSLSCNSLRAQTPPPPSLSFNDLSGKPHALADYRVKIVVLNFLATWCFPCREETPMLAKLSAGYQDKDVSFLLVSLDDAQSQSKIPRFVEKRKITLAIFTGATPATLHDFQLGEIVPATIILDRDGSPVFRILGEASKKEISSRLDWLLSARSSKSPKTLLKNF
jgi:thiol-disulfide isomerase/thioredoxin